MRNRYVLLADEAMFVVAVCGAFGFRFDWYFFKTRPEFVPYLVAALLLKPAVFYGFGMYRRFWRYATIDDMLALALANSAGCVAMAGVVWAGLYVGAIREFSRSVVAADWLLALVATGAIRLSIRVVGESQGRGRREQYDKRVVIVGAGDAGAIVAREMQRNAQLAMRPVGFLDDDPVKLRKRIYGVPVVGRLEDLQGIVQAMQVDQIIIAMPKATGNVVRTVAEDCRRAGVMSRTIPGVF